MRSSITALAAAAVALACGKAPDEAAEPATQDISSMRADSTAEAVAVTDVAKLFGPTLVTLGDPVRAFVNLRTRFASIERVCFAFTFGSDPFDPGEGLGIEPNMGGFGNVSSTPWTDRTICFDAGNPSVLDAFLDGKQHLEITTDRAGAFEVARLEVTVMGVPQHRSPHRGRALAGGAP